jgi:hypothetical protein
MFERAVPRDHDDNPEVEEHARATFTALVRTVELASAAGVIAAPDPVEAAQQIWSTVHGAVALELKGLVLTPDPQYTYQALLATIIRGMAPRLAPLAAQGREDGQGCMAAGSTPR